MQGQTEGLPKNNDTVIGAWEYLLKDNTLRPLSHPVGELIRQNGQDLFLPASNGGGSLIPAFCRAYVQASKREVLAVHVAKGATTITEWQPETQRYQALIKKVLSAKKKVAENAEVGNIYFIWLQGESDAVHGTTENDYYERLTAIKDALKKNLGINIFGIIEVGYFASEASWNKNGDLESRIKNDQAIMQAQERIARDDNDCKILTRICTKISREKEYINPFESGHYNNKAMDLIGEKAALGLVDQSEQN